MNKRMRIVVFVALAVILLLGVSGPAVAREGPRCGLYWMAHDLISQEVVQVLIPGDIDLSEEGDLLTRTCVGNVPLGEPSPDHPDLVYYDLDEMSDYLCLQYGACDIRRPFSVTDEDAEPAGSIVYKGEQLDAEGWWLRVRENGNYILETYFYLSQ